MLVGTRVGASVGMSVGVRVGPPVGKIVGGCEGRYVGWFVGLLLGILVGTRVDSVGNAVVDGGADGALEEHGSIVLLQIISKSCAQPVPVPHDESNSADVHSRAPTCAQSDAAAAQVKECIHRSPPPSRSAYTLHVAVGAWNPEIRVSLQQVTSCRSVADTKVVPAALPLPRTI
jgi:hypothetical protein